MGIRCRRESGGGGIGEAESVGRGPNAPRRRRAPPRKASIEGEGRMLQMVMCV